MYAGELMTPVSDFETIIAYNKTTPGLGNPKKQTWVSWNLLAKTAHSYE